MKLLLGLALSYLIGAIPTGYIVGRAVKGIDIRKQGSGNVGATNVFRVVGKEWGLGVLGFDILKGFLAVSVLAPDFSTSFLSPFLNSLLLGMAAIAGHTWTVWLGFRGGKGVATSLGVFLALAPRAVGLALVVWNLLFLWKRYVSLGSLGMAASFPVWVLVFYRREEYFLSLFLISLALVVFIFYTHRENIKRLREGTEKKLI
jgi:glycerol-3-phosphate acyltransferase PlsY